MNMAAEALNKNKDGTDGSGNAMESDALFLGESNSRRNEPLLETPSSPVNVRMSESADFSVSNGVIKSCDVIKRPNDPSSPTPATKTPDCQPEGNAGVGCSAWLGGTDVVTIACITEDEKVVSQVSINSKYLNPARPDVLERALNRMVDEINNSPSSLVGKAFRIGTNHLNHAL